MDILVFLLMGICIIPIYLGRKRIGFYFCPEEVMGFRKKNHYLAVYSILPALLIVAFAVSYLRELILSIESISKYENYSLVVGLMLFFILLYAFGLMTEIIVYHSNERYKKWKDKAVRP
ncbi:hypothetical protein E9993_17840 [Labilibacter sediminis]|nr:hypothetical protein E9993_17840 [Labilibacter sediminis]